MAWPILCAIIQGVSGMRSAPVGKHHGDVVRTLSAQYALRIANAHGLDQSLPIHFADFQPTTTAPYLYRKDAHIIGSATEEFVQLANGHGICDQLPIHVVAEPTFTPFKISQGHVVSEWCFCDDFAEAHVIFSAIRLEHSWRLT
jgi:hypothetical protein